MYVLLLLLLLLLSMLHYSGVTLHAVTIHAVGSVLFVGDAVTSLSHCIPFTISNNTPIL